MTWLRLLHTPAMKGSIYLEPLLESVQETFPLHLEAGMGGVHQLASVIYDYSVMLNRKLTEYQS